MKRPAGSGRRAAAAAAILLGVLVLMSLVVVVEKPSTTAIGGVAIGGRRMLAAGDEGEMRRSLEDFSADDPFQDSERKVPNGPDPIHNRGAGKSGRSPGRA
ncbi:CLAVATA3/ESR (CLE)-related protein 25-like [Lolium rigidum]|uniref:CLAVATA3/ESR (CLE)-related protein 25-like n=1 Tax=Lolium rigidum TaxID=89674 RepID=UPI001F5D51D4|nr:CLAVATA3/ESR (CLE)-related protein 25-like [Lolium rigidum]